MIYILSGLTGLLILVALFTFIHKRRHSEDPETIVAPPADCCGAHAICEKGLKKASPQIDYFDDEELDVYRQIAPEAYTDEQIQGYSLHPSSGRSRRMADQPGKKRNQSPLNPASGSDRVNPLTGFQISISLKFPALICIADNDGTRNIPGLVL